MSSALKQWGKKLLFVPTEKVTENRHPRLPPPTHAISQPGLLRVGKHGPAYGWCYQESFAGWLLPHVLAILPSSSRNNNSKKRLQLELDPVVLLHHSCLYLFLFPLYHFSFFVSSTQMTKSLLSPPIFLPPRCSLWGNATPLVAMEP